MSRGRFTLEYPFGSDFFFLSVPSFYSLAGVTDDAYHMYSNSFFFFKDLYLWSSLIQVRSFFKPYAGHDAFVFDLNLCPKPKFRPLHCLSNVLFLESIDHLSYDISTFGNLSENLQKKLLSRWPNSPIFLIYKTKILMLLKDLKILLNEYNKYES